MYKRQVLRYAEQASNHYIAFKLLALIRDKVFGALRRLTPAKLEGRDRGDQMCIRDREYTLQVQYICPSMVTTAMPILVQALRLKAGWFKACLLYTSRCV